MATTAGASASAIPTPWAIAMARSPTGRSHKRCSHGTALAGSQCLWRSHTARGDAMAAACKLTRDACSPSAPRRLEQSATATVSASAATTLPNDAGSTHDRHHSCHRCDHATFPIDAIARHGYCWHVARSELWHKRRVASTELQQRDHYAYASCSAYASAASGAHSAVIDATRHHGSRNRTTSC